MPGGLVHLDQVLIEASGDAALYLYDVIVSDDYWGGISAEKFVKELNALDAPTIHLRINSPGGEVFAARAIEAAIRNHPARIVAQVDGYAASAASFVAVACDEVEIAPGGFFMIHKAWTFTAGNADDLLHTAEMLEKLDAIMGTEGVLLLFAHCKVLMQKGRFLVVL